VISTRLISITFFSWLLCGVCFGQCPTLSVVGPPGVTNPGDKMTFRVDGGAVDLKYSWTVSAGTIVGGQATPVIFVATDRRLAGSNVTATVTIEVLRSECKNSASETAPVAAWPEWESMDEWGDLKDNDQRSRLDSFFTELANNPHNIGLVILLTTKRERRDERNRRVQLVLDHAKFRNFDKNRIWFCLESSTLRRTKIYRFPPGLEDEIPYENCLIIKGGDLQ
jgi:hypothetical protein